jgi:hypothetical protein
MPASYQNLKNPGIQADFVIRHRHDKGWIDGNKGHPQTDALHVTERFLRVWSEN